ncbi:helix-hairpin-helix domain-containing protein [Natronococcus wangiae]|uniref:helix-hairpin-helix domain-containing protein n=1 Tax=Natronococcus wangiae TaxID=3068275 RepID=UPI00273F7F88|nr:helix-hairpin-helix domain-containing protein [Natronococcus sp. AD5]
MFDVQRTAVKQGQQLFKQSLAAQRNADRVVLTGLKSQESLQRQQLEIVEAATRGTVSAMTAMMPGGQPAARQGIDEHFAQLKTTHEAIYDAIERELERNVESIDELSEGVVDAMEAGTEQVLESSHTVEDQTVDNVGELSTQLREQLERTQEMQDELEDRLERQSGDVEELLERQAEQIESFQQQLEEQTEQVQLQFEEGERERTKIRTDPEHALEDIDGIGATTRERLADAGIATIDDLTRSDPETVAEAAEVSTSRAREWIDQAEA